MDLSVIIVNWHSVDYLKRCLTSLYRETHGVQFQVIVVDNASFDGSEEFLQAEFPEAVFIQSRENLGFARANNLGYRQSSGEYLLFLNPDTEIRGDAIVKMMECLRSQPDAGIIGPRLLNTDGSLQTSCVLAFPTIANQLLDCDVLRRAFPTWHIWGAPPPAAGRAAPATVEAVAGACMMIRRSVFERVGLFTETYFMYSDDLDLCYKAASAGYRTLYGDECTVIHHGKKSSEKQGEHFSTLWQRRSLAHFFYVTRGARYAGAYRVAMACAALLRIALAPFVVLFGRVGVQHTTPLRVLKKWLGVFWWAIGLDPQRVQGRN